MVSGSSSDGFNSVIALPVLVMCKTVVEIGESISISFTTGLSIIEVSR